MVDCACLVNLIKLLNGVLLLEIETEDRVHRLAHSGNATDEQDLLG